MGTFKSSKIIYAAPAIIPAITAEIVNTFRNEGYEVESQELISGGHDISITKGGTFKAVLGMKSALKVSVMPQGGNIYIEAGVGIFGQQAIPAIISMFFLWPVLLTQLWGMVQQSKLDEHAIDIAEAYIARNHHQSTTLIQPATHQTPPQSCKYCTSCGSPQSQTANYCSACGAKL